MNITVPAPPQTPYDEQYLDLRRLMEHKAGNESDGHWLLKQVAMYWLYCEMGCKAVADEIPVDRYGYLQHRRELMKQGFRRTKQFADAVGISAGNYSTKFTSRAVEVKVSRSDFRSGFCVGTDLVYILAPKGVLTKDDIPKRIGFIEADLEKLAVRIRPSMMVMGFDLVKRPARLARDDRAKDSDIRFWLLHIARTHTLERLLGRDRVVGR